jgi:hypothetical protein
MPVCVGAVTRQVTQPSRIELTDPVLDPGVFAMAQFEAAGLPATTPGPVMNAVTRSPSE